MATKISSLGGLSLGRSAGLAAALAALSAACTHREPAPTPLANAAATHHAVNGHAEPEVIPPQGTPAWNKIIDRRLQITDAAGHGPDLGSAEWMGAVGKKCGISALKPGSDAWFRAVNAKVFGQR